MIRMILTTKKPSSVAVSKRVSAIIMAAKENRQSRKTGYEAEEELIVPFANAGADPRAVVVEPFDADVAFVTV
jgi:hypothetical protein